MAAASSDCAAAGPVANRNSAASTSATRVTTVRFPRVILLRPLDLRWTQCLRHRNLNQRVFRARPGNGAAIAVHATVVTDAQHDRPQPQRLLALHRAFAAAVALVLVDDVFVEV